MCAITSCPSCFGDPHLRKEVIPNLATTEGECSTCGANSDYLINPQDLNDLFELVAGAYSESESGEPLAHWLEVDWALFGNLDRPKIRTLLETILDDPEVTQRRVAPTRVDTADATPEWKSFREELMHTNRFFTERTVDLERLGELLSHIMIDLPGDPPFYRARIQENETAFAADRMGAPPAKKATHGRANPAGIPYLYIASCPTTAIAEVRPHTGELVSVASVEVPQRARIVDLATPRRTVSPFVLADSQQISLLRSDIGFLEHLGSELSQPVLPQEATVSYIPTQYLCELIKHRGFDGVRYSSAVGTGFNIALFSQEACVISDGTTHRVTEVSVEHEPFVR